MTQWMIYGANGYTGRLTAIEAVRRGMRPVLAGRNQVAVEALAAELGLEARIFGLDEPARVCEELKSMRLVLHCAGPFSATSQPMIEACLATHTHYLDITGEISVFENAWKQSDRARQADIVLCPGVGFDVVPSDCLAATLVDHMPAATRLQLAFEAGGGMSPGTQKTSFEGLANGGKVRKEGKLKTVPLGWKTRRIPFAHAERLGVTIPWGDVFTAWVSTGVPDVEVYVSVHPSAIKRLQRLRLFQPLLKLGFVQSFMKKQIEKRNPGPSDEARSSTGSQLWGEASSGDKRRVWATMTTPNGYDITVTASLGVVEDLLKNDREGGYYTPSLLMGSGYAATLPGVSVTVHDQG